MNFFNEKGLKLMILEEDKIWWSSSRKYLRVSILRYKSIFFYSLTDVWNYIYIAFSSTHFCFDCFLWKTYIFATFLCGQGFFLPLPLSGHVYNTWPAKDVGYILKRGTLWSSQNDAKWNLQEDEEKSLESKCLTRTYKKQAILHEHYYIILYYIILVLKHIRNSNFYV